MSIMFMGTSTHNLDQKNRLAVPTRFREALGTEFVVCKPLNGESRCLYLLTKEKLDEVHEKIRANSSGETRTKLERKLFRFSEKVESDAQGRFTIPAEFCEFASLKKSVAVFGAGERIEIWDCDAFNALDAADDDGDELDTSWIDY